MIDLTQNWNGTDGKDGWGGRRTARPMMDGTDGPLFIEGAVRPSHPCINPSHIHHVNRPSHCSSRINGARDLRPDDHHAPKHHAGV